MASLAQGVGCLSDELPLETTEEEQQIFGEAIYSIRQSSTITFASLEVCKFVRAKTTRQPKQNIVYNK